MITLATAPSDGEMAGLLIEKWATAEDHTRAESRKNAAARANFLLTRAVTRAALTRATDKRDWQFSYDAQGKPKILTMAGTEGPHISLSHTHGLVGCAISEKFPIGFDVEYWRPRDFMALANYAFGPCECEEVARNGMAAFYRIWTVREAIAKLTGKGTMSMIDGQDYAVDASAPSCWVSGEWGLYYATPQPDYSLAMASTNEDVWSSVNISWLIS